ncbi:MAG: hypothetical protein K2L72_00420, partial [Clostridia bacterium]|nr:hypothetical protein [Clostridia bacterium]
VTAKAVGTAIITATTANNKTAECSVTVKAKEMDILAGKTYDFHDVICTNGDIPLNGFKAGLSNSKVVFANDGTCTVGNEDNNVKYAYSVDEEKVKIGAFEYIMKDDELSYSMQTEPYNVVVIYKLQTEE